MKNKIKIIILSIGVIIAFILLAFASKNKKLKRVYKRWIQDNKEKIEVIQKEIEKKKSESKKIKDKIKESEEKVKDAKNSKADTVDNADDARTVLDDILKGE